MRGSTPSGMRPARRSACASRRSSATSDSAPTPFAPEATTLATVSPRALVRLEGAFYSVPTSLGRARSGRAHRRDDGDDRRPRGDADSASAPAVWAAVDRLPALPVGARAEAAGGAPGAARSPPGSRRARFRRSGISSTRRTGRVTPRGSSPKSSASSTRYGAAVVVPALTAALGDRDAAAARADAGASGARPASRPTRCPPRSATSTSRAAVPPTTTAGSSRWAHERPHDGPRSGRRPHARAEAARRGPHV